MPDKLPGTQASLRAESGFAGGVTHSSQVEDGGEAGRGRGAGSIRLEESTDQQGHLNIHPSFCHLGVQEHRTNSGLWGQLQDAGWLTTSARSTEQGGADHALVSPRPPDSTSRRGDTALSTSAKATRHAHSPLQSSLRHRSLFPWTARGLMATRGYCTFGFS